MTKEETAKTPREVVRAVRTKKLVIVPKHPNNIMMIVIAAVVIALMALVLMPQAAEPETKPDTGSPEISAPPVCGDSICNEEPGICPEDCVADDGYDLTVKLIGDVESSLEITLISGEGNAIGSTSTAENEVVFDTLTLTSVGVVVENPSNGKRVISSISDVTGKDMILLTLPEGFFSEFSDRPLDQNVFDDTIGIMVEDEYKRGGYVIVRYFHSQNCLLCVNPVDWGNVLTEIAGEMNGIVILETFDTESKKWAASNWATVGLGKVSNPAIRMEGVVDGEPAYRVYYGNQLNGMYSSPKESLVQEICKYTDEC